MISYRCSCGAILFGFSYFFACLPKPRDWCRSTARKGTRNQLLRWFREARREARTDLLSAMALAFSSMPGAEIGLWLGGWLSVSYCRPMQTSTTKKMCHHGLNSCAGLGCNCGLRQCIYCLSLQIDGSLPRNALRLVQAWVEIHKDELIKNYEASLTEVGTISKIEPLK